MKNNVVQMILGTLVLIPSLSFAAIDNGSGNSQTKKYTCDQVLNSKASNKAKRSIDKDSINVSILKTGQIIVEGLLHSGVGHECDSNVGNTEICNQQVLQNGDIKTFQMSTGGQYGRQYSEALFSPSNKQLRVRHSTGYYVKTVQFDAVLSCREVKEFDSNFVSSEKARSGTLDQSAQSAQ